MDAEEYGDLGSIIERSARHERCHAYGAFDASRHSEDNRPRKVAANRPDGLCRKGL